VEEEFSEEDFAELDRLVEMMNQRGHAHVFARATREDKQIVERLTAQEWGESMSEQFGMTISGVASNDDDPPDCVAVCSGRKISIELAELVDSMVLATIADARRAGLRITAYDQLFDLAQWSSKKFKKATDDLLDRKQHKYGPRGVSVDVLIIHTGEPWLSPADVAKWLPTLQFQPRPFAQACYLLMDYVPGFAVHWPVFRIYGSL
jgi:hypothetical protein